MVDIVLDPLLWESMQAGDSARVASWQVSEGERVTAGQHLATARLVHESIDVLAPRAGCIEQILVPAGETFGVGHPLARLVPF